MHAKFVVVDDRVAFISSANFSDAAVDRNLETGVLLVDPGSPISIQATFRV